MHQKNKVLEDIKTKLNALTHKDTLQKPGWYTLIHWSGTWSLFRDLSSTKYWQKYYGKGSPNQHIYHFYSLIGNVMGNDALMTLMFVVSLKGIAFDWFWTFPVGSIKFWTDLEAQFLTHFYEDNAKVFMLTLIKEKLRKIESMKDFIERLRNLSLRCLEGIPLSMLPQICRHNI